MIVLWAPLRALSALNSFLLLIGRNLAWLCLAAMVCSILAQVFFRYVIGNALPWSEELARFLMLWMTGLIAPSALRWGGFVAIDMVPAALPRVPGLVLNLLILFASLLVLSVGVKLGYAEITGFGGRFNSPSLKVPLSLIGGETIVVKKAWMMASLFVFCALAMLVNIELILRNLIAILDKDAELPVDRHIIAAGSD